LVTLGGTEEVEINVGENEEGFFIYLWAGLPNRLQVSVRSPLGQLIDRVPIFNERIQTYQFKLEQAELSVQYLYPDPYSGNEAAILRLSQPTPGIWTVIVSAEGIVTGEYHMWLSRRGFISETTRFLRPEPQTTVQIPGTDGFSIVVGAYDNSDDSVYAASGRGPTTNDIIKPDETVDTIVSDEEVTNFTDSVEDFEEINIDDGIKGMPLSSKLQIGFRG